MAKLFRWVGSLEAASFLILLLIAMPMKYIGGNPIPVKITGWIHGLLFAIYIAVAYQLASERKWPTRTLLLAFIAAVLPTGPIWFHWKYKDKIS